MTLKFLPSIGTGARPKDPDYEGDQYYVCPVYIQLIGQKSSEVFLCDAGGYSPTDAAAKAGAIGQAMADALNTGVRSYGFHGHAVSLVQLFGLEEAVRKVLATAHMEPQLRQLLDTLVKEKRASVTYKGSVSDGSIRPVLHMSLSEIRRLLAELE
jgi:hypothetical protein